MDILTSLQTLLKRKIHFKTLEGDYEGIVRLVCPLTRKIILENVIFIPKCLCMGVVHFHIDEILSYKVISPDHSTTLNKKMFANHSSSKDIPKEKDFILKLPQHLNLKLPTHSVVLDCLNKDFHQAISIIQKEDSIGVSLDGPSIGRDGILSWISITTQSCTFLFDIQNLKYEAFKTENKFKMIFENPKIEKIIHDCRKASDCLFHKFNTKIINVFDTQVAELLVTLQVNQKGTIPQKVNNLSFCLHKYLDIPSEFLPQPKQRSYIDDVIYYQQRPLQNETRNLLIRNVVYLRALKCKLHRLLLNPFYRAVDVYLQVVQNATDRELLLEPSSKDEVPLQLIIDGLQTVRFRDSVFLSPIASPETSVVNPIANYTNMCKSNKYSIRSPPNSTCSSPVIMDKTNQFNFAKQLDNTDSVCETVHNEEFENKKLGINDNKFADSASMKNNESLNEKAEMTNKERFRLNRQKFNTYVKPIVNFGNGHGQSQTSNSGEDTYLKLQEECAKEVEDKEKQKLKFIPAGMS